MINRFQATRFTAFEQLDMSFSEGINILLGENGTGKTHVMKSLYAACSSRIGTKSLEEKLMNIFLPDSLGRLVHRRPGRRTGEFIVTTKQEDNSTAQIKCSITSLGRCTEEGTGWRNDTAREVTYIPVKDVLANAPGFRSLYSKRHISFEEIYADIIDQAFLPISRGKQSKERKVLLEELQSSMNGKIVQENEHFYLHDEKGNLEFSLLAEGYRKLGLLYLLIQNETLTKGSVLFWDEPEANLNPSLAKTVVNILLKLQEMGVQIFIATHDYVTLKYFELFAHEQHKLCYHHLHRNQEGRIECFSTYDIEELPSTGIDEAFDDLLDQEIQKKMNQ